MRTGNLCLHCEAKEVKRERLAEIITPKPTETWHPVSHYDLLGGIQATLEGSRLHVVSESHALTREGARYFGLLQIAGEEAERDYGMVLGIRNSHDKSFPVGLAVGAAVFICDNLSFSGEVKLFRKHTSHVQRDLPQLIERAVGKLGDLRRTQDARFAWYKEFALSDAQVHDLAIQTLDARIVPVVKIPDLLAEWRQPRHPEFAKEQTAWRFFNAVPESIKGSLDLLPKRTQALHGLLDSVCGLSVSQN